MSEMILIPHKALRPYIQHYVYLELGKPGEWSQTNMAPPGCPSLSVSLGRENILIRENEDAVCDYESITFVGQTTRFRKISLFDRLKSFFIIFKPCGAYQLLGVHQGECKNLCINISDLLGSSARIFKEEMTEQTGVKSLKKVLETFFLKRLSQEKIYWECERLARVLEQIKMYNNHFVSIEEICHQQGYSISRLERHMRRIVGLSPKQYQRIIRFNRVLTYINRNQCQLKWTRIANRFGYFDQTHFIKEFKLFYGKTPAKYSSADQFLSKIAYQKGIRS